ncbi:MAG TPA: PfkB family carbohydrate kinase, partial [Ktedonobacteraceae bacterium]|nr:PfkB family carbohydrate kinase [Ktedonobacteraceae bacterium]
DVNASKGVDHAAMRVLGQRLLSLIDAENVAITIAKDGVFLANRQGLAKHLPAYPVFHPNDIGAGDSFAAALALSLAAGASIEDAGSIAIDASSIAVTKRWTAIVTHQELLQRASLRDATAQIHTFASTDDRRNTGDFDYKKNGGATIDALVAKLEQERQRGRTIVFTNGIFDILHAGHVQLLRQAKTLGDILVVGVNSDRSAQHSKGRHRPINSERDRAALVDALDVVDYVVLFDEAIPLELLRKLRPQLFVKGGDYIDEALPEAEVVQQYGGRVIILPLAGASARSDVIGRIASLISSEQ